MTDLQEKTTYGVGIPRDKAPEPVLGTEPIIFGDRYYSEEFAQKEWDHMWTRVWQIAGRVDQIPVAGDYICLLYTSPSPRDRTRSRMPSSA